MNIEQAIERVRTGPHGPEIAAFFDFDGTIVHGFSGVHFFRDRMLAGKVSASELAATMINGLRGTESEEDFERFVAIAFKAWRGHTEDELYEIAKRLKIDGRGELLAAAGDLNIRDSVAIRGAVAIIRRRWNGSATG